VLCGRNSYSKTDPDATIMRMKEDHMQNGQLKPGYNMQISTSGQVIVNYSIHQTPGDSTTLPAHLGQFGELLGQVPDAVTADAGYGSEENYAFMEGLGIEAFVKHNQFDREQQGKAGPSPFRVDALHYNPRTDTYYCPMGQPMRNTGTRRQRTTTGYVQEVTHYKAANCNGCPLRGACHKGRGDRVVEVNHNAARHRRQASERLRGERGVAHRKKRPWDVESVFGNIKWNKGFRRFMLRGMAKVEIEAGLLAIAHNIQKIAS